MSSRWDHLPISEQEQRHLASTTSTSALPTASTVASIRRNIGALIRQEIAENDQFICYYKSLIGDSTIPYLCELGCCQSGCCTPAEITAQPSSYGWAIALLIVFLLVICFSIIAILSVWILNRQKEKMHKQELQEQALESSSASQISGPASYYNNEMFYPYTYTHKY